MESPKVFIISNILSLSLSVSQGTCLSLLNSLLISEDDNDHLQKIIRVPSEPLLMYLEPYEMSGSDADSGIGSRHLSRTTPSGSDNQVLRTEISRLL